MSMVSLCNRHGYIEVTLSTTYECETAGFVVVAVVVAKVAVVFISKSKIKINAAVASRRKCVLRGRKKNRIVENLGDSGRGYNDVRGVVYKSDVHRGLFEKVDGAKRRLYGLWGEVRSPVIHGVTAGVYTEHDCCVAG